MQENLVVVNEPNARDRGKKASLKRIEKVFQALQWHLLSRLVAQKWRVRALRAGTFQIFGWGAVLWVVSSEFNHESESYTVRMSSPDVQHFLWKDLLLQ